MFDLLTATQLIKKKMIYKKDIHMVKIKIGYIKLQHFSNLKVTEYIKKTKKKEKI